jgi:hypothetical protein
MRFFLDENFSEHVADALNSLSKGYFPGTIVTSTKKEFRVGIPDPDLIPAVGKLSGVIITRDKGMGHLRGHAQLCKQHSVGLIVVSLPGMRELHWELVRLLVKHWETLVDTCNSTRHPFMFKLTQKGLHPIS